MLQRSDSYEAVRSRFRWTVPEFFNIGVDICDKWAANSTRLALIHERRDGFEIVASLTMISIKQTFSLTNERGGVLWLAAKK